MSNTFNPSLTHAAYRQRMRDFCTRIISMDNNMSGNDEAFGALVNNMLFVWISTELTHHPEAFKSTLLTVNKYASTCDLEQQIDELLASIDKKALLLESLSERMQISLQLLNDNFSQLLNGDTHE